MTDKRKELNESLKVVNKAIDDWKFKIWEIKHMLKLKRTQNNAELKAYYERKLERYQTDIKRFKEDKRFYEGLLASLSN